jgi:serine/threonine protein kinase
LTKQQGSEERRFGRYKVLRVLGKGAMGEVFLAEDPAIGRQVAIKVLQLQEGLEGAELDSLQARFEQEFRLAGSLAHPNIVTIYDVGREGECSFVAMEYIQGSDLREMIHSDDGLSLRQVASIAQQVGDALDHAHEKGVIHRDVKPANIMITRQGRPKLADFGIAKVNTSTLTQTGMLIGTPAYMSPEQVTGQEITPRSDQFAFAVVLYEMLTGRQPFLADSPTSTMFKIVNQDYPDPLELKPDLPSAVPAVLARGLSKDPAHRYASCHDLAKALAAAIEGRHMPAEPDDATATRLSSPPYATASPDDATVVSTGKGSLSTLSAEELAASAGSGTRPMGLIAGVVAAVIVVAGMLWFFWPAAEQPPVEQSPAISGTPSGTESGADGGAGLTASSDAGAADAQPGETDGAARTEATEEETPPEPTPPPPLELSITSAPAGAIVTLDGERIESVTPAAISVTPGEEHSLRLELDGYESATYSFSDESLTAEQRDSGTLHFPLTASIPPGSVVLEAPYAVTIRIAGRSYGPSSEHRISLRPGRYEARITAPAVHLDMTTSVEVQSERQVSLEVPETVVVDVLAAPSNCKIFIDGREVDFAPLNDLQITVGRHEFRFEWPPPTDTSRTVTEVIRRDGQRIFGRAQ